MNLFQLTEHIYLNESAVMLLLRFINNLFSPPKITLKRISMEKFFWSPFRITKSDPFQDSERSDGLLIVSRVRA